MQNELQLNRNDLFITIDNLKPEDWQKKGRHASLRILTIEEIITLIADHEKDHLKKIQHSLARPEPSIH
jgi:hypothetical protein